MKTIITRIRIDTHNCDFLFAYCDSFQTVKDYAKKNRKDFTKSEYREIMEQDEYQVGMVLSDDDTNFPYLLYINNKKRGWFLWDTVTHETNHMVFYLSRHFEFREETENQATLQEYLSRTIRNLIKK